MSSSNAKNITVSTENNFFQRAQVLKTNREKRNRYNEFLLEGVTHITRALENGWKIRALLYSRERGLSEWAKGIFKKAGAEVHADLSAALLEKLSEKEEPSELLAIVEMAANEIKKIPVEQSDGLVVVFDRPSNPGNLGTSIRSCDAFGVQGVIVTGHAADLYHPQTVRGTMGALFTVPTYRGESHEQVKSWVDQSRKRGAEYQVIGTSAKGEKSLAEVDFCRPTVLVMGNETVGMSKAYKELCDCSVRIPIQGANSSVNVSCAASILLYEIARQRKQL